MMTLEQWLTANNINQLEFGRRIGVNQATVSKLARKMFTPRLELAAKIERETGGAIPVSFWIEAPKADAGAAA